MTLVIPSITGHRQAGHVSHLKWGITFPSLKIQVIHSTRCPINLTIEEVQSDHEISHNLSRLTRLTECLIAMVQLCGGILTDSTEKRQEEKMLILEIILQKALNQSLYQDSILFTTILTHHHLGQMAKISTGMDLNHQVAALLTPPAPWGPAVTWTGGWTSVIFLR